MREGAMNNQGNVATGRRRGFTLTELIIAVSIFLLVTALIGFPLFSAFSYLQKAAARSDALNASRNAMQRLTSELGDAVYIFDQPPDGSAITFIPNTSADLSSNSAINIVTYSHVLDFPWVYRDVSGTSQWVLLEPNWWEAPDDATALTYKNLHLPYYTPNYPGDDFNPYILARYEPPKDDDGDEIVWINNGTGDEQVKLTWDVATTSATDNGNTALSIVFNQRYPLYTPDYDDATQMTLQKYSTQLKRRFTNDMIAVTPKGTNWDVPRFQALPMRVDSETLAMPVGGNGKKVPTHVTARYPLIAGRNIDHDVLPTDADVLAMYHLNTLTNLYAIINAATPLYQNQVTYNASDPPTRETVNPFGFRLHVYNRNGGLVYGYNESTSTMVTNRHVMDWPPIDRLDFVNTTNNAFSSATLWTLNTITQQRMAGKFVFAQPIKPIGASQNIDNVTHPYSTTSLTIPSSWSATSSLTYLITPPRRIKLQEYSETFRLVNKAPEDLGEYEYCLLHPGVYDGTSRQIALRASATTPMLPNTVTIEDIPTYTICDLQPTDTVVATYATKAVQDVGLTISRRDRTGSRPEDRRQDYTANVRIEVKNAFKHARHTP